MGRVAQEIPVQVAGDILPYSPIVNSILMVGENAQRIMSWK